ncbi:cytochrome c [Marinihelvus fidelis]|uniref:Cytochrome c n=1 Tax=Marinihelvus fidelis TaxID=2613842 RepID=A0A5N0T8X1_9GAMM|nr:cytochrome c [Marinihelvus fidelis]KAA9131390.1 cytochrome c [Marinihelvus fidelis]
MKNALIATLAATTLLAAAAFADTEDPIEQRQELMKQTREALKPLMGMTKGEIDFDVVTMRKSLAVFAETGKQFGDLFPPGSETGHDTEAKSTIWSDPDGFRDALGEYNHMVSTTIQANPHSVEGLKFSLNNILKTCKGCHDDYRVEKD